MLYIQSIFEKQKIIDKAIAANLGAILKIDKEILEEWQSFYCTCSKVNMLCAHLYSLYTCRVWKVAPIQLVNRMETIYEIHYLGTDTHTHGH